ncbi:MAG: 30S ribosomal protein S8 [Acidiferrobacterales bacterium]|nr:30S ribosomal protein S8 [Acidiferrobacterales bacterium]
MSMSDPIADMLTRIRNGLHAEKADISMPASRTKASIAEVLKQEGYIKGYKTAGEGATKTLDIELKYFQGAPVIEEIIRISKPGRRVYAGASDIPKVRDGLGVALVSTSRGIMTDKSARESGVGGEILCTVF